MPDRPGLLCFGGFARHDWSLLWQRQQSVMTRFAKHFDIHYIERFGTRALTIREMFSAAWKRLAARRPGGLSDEMHGVRFIAPGVSPFHGSPARRRRNVEAVRRAIDGAWPAGLKKKILWISNPSYVALEYLKSARGQWDKTVYDCVQRFEFNRNYPPGIGEIDREIARSVDVVFCDSRTIFAEKQKLNENTHLIPQGVDVERFLYTGVNCTPPDDLRWLKRPIFGYHGAWHQAFDADLVGSILDGVKDATFAFVGPTEGSDPEWRKKYWQATFTGPRDHIRLGRYVNAFTVCLIPYRLDEHTQGVFPTKFFEYVATGLPIVATDLPDLREYREWVTIAKDRGEFLEAARVAAQRERRPVEDVRPFVEQHTWDRRVEQMLEQLGV